MRNDSTVVIPGAGHGMHQENPRYFNAILRRYLAGR
jgi:pimeloyl-ACP methyl ester carboxylesterase